MAIFDSIKLSAIYLLYCRTHSHHSTRVCVDELHTISEPSRGSTLEACLSRIKVRAPHCRFILVSATVPNAKDIAEWIGSGQQHGGAAAFFEVSSTFS